MQNHTMKSLNIGKRNAGKGTIHAEQKSTPKTCKKCGYLHWNSKECPKATPPKPKPTVPTPTQQRQQHQRQPQRQQHQRQHQPLAKFQIRVGYCRSHHALHSGELHLI